MSSGTHVSKTCKRIHIAIVENVNIGSAALAHGHPRPRTPSSEEGTIVAISGCLMQFKTRNTSHGIPTGQNWPRIHVWYNCGSYQSLSKMYPFWHTCGVSENRDEPESNQLDH
jgi:hypothetical protein